MTKTLYLIDKVNGTTVNTSCHIQDLLPYIEKTSNVKTVKYDLNVADLPNSLEEINDKADILFVMHDFTLWNNASFDVDFGNFTRFLSRLWNNKNIFVFPTQMANAALIKTQFKANAPLINKIMLGSDSFRKLFVKIDSGLGVGTNKIKCINVPTNEFTFRDANEAKLRANMNKKILFTPGMLHPQKDYLQLLHDISYVLRRYKSVIYVMALKTHPGVDAETTYRFLNDIRMAILRLKLEDRIRLSLDSLNATKYHSYMRISDVVVFPQDNSHDMYNGCLIDALAMGKAIVTPISVFTDDLVKKTSILLYEYENTTTLFDACSVILENRDFRSILEQHNYEYGQTLAYSKIAQQYVNQIKRFKFN